MYSCVWGHSGNTLDSSSVFTVCFCFKGHVIVGHVLDHNTLLHRGALGTIRSTYASHRGCSPNGDI